jgi:ATP-dependent helicase HrpA
LIPTDPIHFPPDLPVSARRAEIAQAIARHPVVIVCGETGSGKTTQLPKICLELGRGQRGRGVIGHTQPRRLAARTVAQRIADELHTPLGAGVGYKIRFQDQTQPGTRVKLMTDGILLAETQTDRDLRQYDTLILDEAHERSLNIDFLLGYLQRLMPRRPDLRLVITSATIDPGRFSRQFGDAPVIEVSGRTYPVTTLYRPLATDERTTDDDTPADGDADLTEIEGVVAAVRELWSGRRSEAGSEIATDLQRQTADAAQQSSADPVPPPPGGARWGRSDASPLPSANDTEPNRQVIPDDLASPHPTPPPNLPQGGRNQKDAAPPLPAQAPPTGRGDTLVFLPTERDIREAAEALEAAGLDADVLPLYSRLSAAEQMRVFRPGGNRPRIVLATNVAETSVTVPGIRYVIDTGLARLSRYNPRTKVRRLPVEPISQASADQRAGRCGRVAPGVCVRLYAEADYAARPRFTDPEILRTDLASVILQMMWLRLGRVEDFPFIDPPDFRQIRDGLNTLHELGAIDDRENITPVGRRLARLPVDVRVARMIVGGQDENCLPDVLIIAAALSTQDVRDRPADQQNQADQAHGHFRDAQSDFVSILKLWHGLRARQRELSNNQFRKWCRANFISYLRYREWTDVHQQLHESLRNVTDKPAGRSRGRGGAVRQSAVVAEANDDPYPPHERDRLHRALLTGLLSNVAMKNETGAYTGARQTRLSIWPGSALFKARPLWVMAAELVETGRLYARTVAAVRPEWIERAAAHLVGRTHTDPHWHAASGHVVASEKVTLLGLILVPKRNVHYGPIDPVQSRQLFIQHALVDGQFRSDHPAVLANRAAVLQIESWQTKLRRRDLLNDSGTRYAFFDARVPPWVFSGPAFVQWTRRGQGSNWHELELTDAELLRPEATDELLNRGAGVPPALPILVEGGRDARPTNVRAILAPLIAAAFPDELIAGPVRLPLQYAFEPGDEVDGVTAVVALPSLSQLSSPRAEWVVPGWVGEKVEALIRSLPKRLRTQFVPAGETAKKTVARLPPFGSGSLLDSVAGLLWNASGQRITRDDFQAEQIPPHLLMRFRVQDAQGRVLQEGRDLVAIRERLGQKVRDSFTALSDVRYTRDDVREWSFGDLPPGVELDLGGVRVLGYPTLIEQGEKLALRLLDSPQTAAKFMPAGLRRLFMIEAASEIKSVLRDLPGLEKMRLNYAPFGTGDDLMNGLALATATRAFAAGDGAIRTKSAFATAAGAAWRRLYEESRSVGRLVTDVLDRYRVIAALLHKDYPPLLVDSVDDMRRQLAALLPKQFLQHVPADKLDALPRYLRGIDVRMSRLSNAGLSRDLTGLGQIRPLQEQYNAAARRAEQRGLISPALDEYRWLLEEFRLSLFAQEVKTAVPVSPKRLAQAWEAVG